MTIIVKKFGGTSVATLEKIKKIARNIKRQVDQGNKLVVILSAMAEVTDQLHNWLSEIAPCDDDKCAAEYDVVLASGEQVTVGLLALYLNNLNIKARSWLAWQIPINTDKKYCNAQIEHIQIDVIKDFLAHNDVAVIAGFQGVNEHSRVTTLGRGGSDTSAVAIAAALGLSSCSIYTDVDGVYSADPRIVTNARKLHAVTYAEMLELSSLGAKIMHAKSIEIAMQYRVELQILSSFEEKSGTLIASGSDKLIDKAITSITYSKNEVLFSCRKIDLQTMLNLLKICAKNNINIDMLQHHMLDNEHVSVTFSLANTLVSIFENAIRSLFLTEDDYNINNQIVKISIVGSHLNEDPNIIYKLHQILHTKKIDIIAMTTTAIKISIIIPADYFELAIRSIHNEFDLDK